MLQPLRSCECNHRAVVGAELGRREIHFESVAVAGVGQLRAQFRIGANAACYYQVTDTAAFERRERFRHQHIDDGSLEIIGQLPNLTFLDIGECKVLKGKTIGELGKLTRLTYLELREIKKVTDDNFAALETLINLTELNLEATRISDASVPTLLKMQKLERLSVAGTQMGDKGMVELSKLPAIKWLDLRNCQPKPETVAALKAARPDLEIVE